MRILVSLLSNVAALWVAARLVEGITYDDLWTLVLAAVVFGIVNFLVRPLLVLLALPAVILTLGLVLLAINALMLVLTDWIVPDFEVADFFWAAVLGAIIVWAVNMALHLVLPEERRSRLAQPRRSRIAPTSSSRTDVSAGISSRSPSTRARVSSASSRARSRPWRET